ncbi:MAG TPA: hypothetical protein DCQ64_23830 [Candidatus Rokubacteria bacterium]|nr:hypothetical protein [Candidatus Rokubacteria bacterium]
MYCELFHLPSGAGRHKGLAGEFDSQAKAAGLTPDDARRFAAEKRRTGEWGKFIKVHTFTRDVLAWWDMGVARASPAGPNRNDPLSPAQLAELEAARARRKKAEAERTVRGGP